MNQNGAYWNVAIIRNNGVDTRKLGVHSARDLTPPTPTRHGMGGTWYSTRLISRSDCSTPWGHTSVRYTDSLNANLTFDFWPLFTISNRHVSIIWIGSLYLKFHCFPFNRPIMTTELLFEQRLLKIERRSYWPLTRSSLNSHLQFVTWYEYCIH